MSASGQRAMAAWPGRRQALARLLRRPPVLAAAVGLVFLIGFSLGAGDGQVQIVSEARVDAAVPAGSRSGTPGTGRDGTPGGAAVPAPSSAARSREDAPLLAYAAPFAPAAGRPWIALLVMDLGLQREVTAAAVTLPDPFSLQFSPYAPDLPAQVAAARAEGHEVLLGLPMEPPDFPDDDPGPHTLLAAAAPEVNLERLHRVMSQARGYVALTGEAGPFASSGAAHPVVRELAASGLGLVEIGGRGLAGSAAAAGLPYASAGRPIDVEPSPTAIDYALAALEAQALETGRAIGVAQPYPVTLERLRAWAATLAHKGLVLAPVSALLRAGTGPAPGDDATTSGGYG